MTALNSTAIGLFGLSVVAPLLARVAARKAQGEVVPSPDKLAVLALGKPFSLSEGIVWQAALAALCLHALAHIVVTFMDKED